MQSIYLNRHFPNRLFSSDLRKLTSARIKAYLKKHRALEFKFKNESYPYSQEDLLGNSYFGTDVEIEFKGYFEEARKILSEKEKEETELG